MQTPRFVQQSTARFGRRRALLAVAVLLRPATAMESENYATNWSVMGGGGEPMRSDTYALNATIGQPSIGFKASTHDDLCSGFWCSGTCAVYLPIVLRSSRPCVDGPRP